jgi:hypothetical protein
MKILFLPILACFLLVSCSGGADRTKQIENSSTPVASPSQPVQQQSAPSSDL